MVSSAAPVLGHAVRPCKEALLGVAERLERPVALNPCGIARVMVLLSDGCGPLYSPAPCRTLEQSVWWIADGLTLCPPQPSQACRT